MKKIDLLLIAMLSVIMVGCVSNKGKSPAGKGTYLTACYSGGYKMYSARSVERPTYSTYSPVTHIVDEKTDLEVSISLGCVTTRITD